VSHQGRLVAGSILLLAAASPAGAVTPAAAAAGTPGYCPGDDGVTVVVDLSELGGDVIVRCAAHATATGIDALSDAGFSVEGTQRWGTAFVCRVAGRPAADEQLAVEGEPDYREQCVQTPPTSAFWAYSYADNGASWTYSTQGASTRRVSDGGFEGWRFVLNGGSTDPAVAPVRPVSEEPDPPPTDEPPEPERPKKSKPPKQQEGPPPGQPRPSSATEDPPRNASPSDDPPPTDEPPEPSPTPRFSDEPRREGREPTGKRNDVDQRNSREQDRPDGQRARTRADDEQPPTEDTDVTGDLPAQNEAPADTGATSSTATLIGAGAVGLIALGAGLSAYRRRARDS
jgi:hypothetical protein